MRTFACLALTISVALLAGCGGSQPPIAAPGNSLRLSLPSLDDTSTSPLALKTCATTPPQYEWIFKGACQKLDLTSTGARFSLGEYRGITVKGSIGENTAKGTVKFALADAIDKDGDIEPYMGKEFPRYEATLSNITNMTYVYAAAVNESSEVVKPVTVQGKPVLRAVITDAKGFGDATTCGLHVLTFPNGRTIWKLIPATGQVMGKTVTIAQYGAPKGFELPPKTPVYFAVNCYKSPETVPRF